MYEQIHKYRGCIITKKKRYYAQGSEKFYTVDGQVFWTLKDAKAYIDRKLENSNTQSL